MCAVVKKTGFKQAFEWLTNQIPWLIDCYKLLIFFLISLKNYNYLAVFLRTFILSFKIILFSFIFRGFTSFYLSSSDSNVFAYFFKSSNYYYFNFSIFSTIYISFIYYISSLFFFDKFVIIFMNCKLISF